MDGADWLRTQLSAFSCSACGRSYRPNQIRVLAQREGLFFVRLTCRGCGTESVAIVTVQIDETESAHLDAGELEETLDQPPGEPAVSGDDVLEMHAFLRDFDGDFQGLFEEHRRPPGRSAGT